MHVHSEHSEFRYIFLAMHLFYFILFLMNKTRHQLMSRFQQFQPEFSMIGL